jgi:GR25 family glycosyltransferase involved in LPS biosynthesis
MKTFVINLDRRPDKWAYVTKELDRVDIVGITRFTAFDTKPGWIGCRESHLAIMEQCKDDTWFAILEDDVLFIGDVDDAFLIDAELPPNWDIIYLGVSPREPQVRYSKRLFKVNNAVCMHAYIMTNKNGCVDYVLNHRDEIKKIDDFFAKEVQPRFNCFVVYPMLVTQTQFDSDTCHRSDVSTILTNFNLYCK